MTRALAFLTLLLLPAAALAQVTPMTEEKLKLLQSDTPITPEQAFEQDPEAGLEQAYKCGGYEALNSYISRLYGRQEIHYAAVHGDTLRLKQLLLEGEDVNVQDNLKATPLMLAAGNGKAEVVKILLAAGADTTLKDATGRTAYDRSLAEGWPEIAALLEPYRKAGPVPAATSH